MTQQQPQPRRKRFIPKYDVEGVYRVVLGEETQLQIEILVGTNVNAQYPWKMVSKASIVENLEVGGELSEFFPLKEQIEQYEPALVLMGYISDESSDVDEFYICLTVEARDHCKQQSDRFVRRLEKKLEKAVQKKPRPWTSLGSEKEIIELIPINTRPLMEIEVKATFPSVYQPSCFNVRDCDKVRDGFIELKPYRQKFFNVFGRRVTTASQAAPAMIDTYAQTELRYPQNKWTQSIADALGKYEDPEAAGDAGQDAAGEGGDEDNDESSSDEDAPPKEPPDEIGLAAYRNARKRMRRPSYIKLINNFMMNKHTEMDSIIELNTVMDIYCNDYPKLVTSKSKDDYSSMTFDEYVCFTDVRAKNKYIACAQFHPMWTGIVAICYADTSPAVMTSISSRVDPIDRAVYGINPVMIWSHIDSLIPKLTLESPREVKVLSFCPFDENILVGGCINGQIILWDLTNKLENVETVEVLSEKKKKYKIAMNAHMWWMKIVTDIAIVPPTAMSNLMTSHYGPVTSVQWLSPNFNVTLTGKTRMAEGERSKMFFTGSQDGTILIWSLSVKEVKLFESKKVKKSKRVLRRPSGLTVDVSPYKVLDRTWQPCYKLVLGIAGHPQVLCVQSFGLDRLHLKYIDDPTITGKGRKYFKCEILDQTENEILMELYAGSLHGEVRRASWEGHAFNTGEVVNSEHCDIKFNCFIHDGIVTCVQKNPFINDISLSVGGKIFAVWSNHLIGRPLFWKKRPYRLTDASWSLYKPSVAFIATSEGSLETWDFLLKSDKPISIQTMSGTMLTGVHLHTLPLKKNIIAVSDTSGSLRMFLSPAIFMIRNKMYKLRMLTTIKRELNVMNTFLAWQAEWMKQNPHIFLEIKRKENALLAEKEEEKRRLKEEEDQKLEEEAEARRIEKMRVIGPEERWQIIIHKLIERTIAVKKRINRAELIEHEKPLRELEAQRLEKERRMLDIMKNQKTIFNDTVAILFPEAIKKPVKLKKSLLTADKFDLEKEYLEDYENLKKSAHKAVINNPFKAVFSWENTLAEGKERRQSLNAYEDYIKMHKCRIEDEFSMEVEVKTPKKKVVEEEVGEEEMKEDGQTA